MRVLQLGGDRNFATETSLTHSAGELRLQYLERHQPAVSCVLGQVDCGHAPATDFPRDLVAVTYRRLELNRGVKGHSHKLELGRASARKQLTYWVSAATMRHPPPEPGTPPVHPPHPHCRRAP